MGLFFALRHRQNLGTLKTWLLFFLISLAVGTGLAEASLNWSQLPNVMQLGGKETTAGENGQAGKVSVRILEGSSIPGNPGYEPRDAAAGKGDLVSWINTDAAPHTVTSGAGVDDLKFGMLFDSGPLGHNREFLMSMDSLEAGEHDYYCTIHPFMKGTVTVR